MKLKFNSTEKGIEIVDPFKRYRYQITTGSESAPREVDTSQFWYPVDAAVEVVTDSISFPTDRIVYVLDREGEMVAEVRPSDVRKLSEGEYTLDITGPLKVNIRIEGQAHIYSDDEQTHIDLKKQKRVVIGARSFHTQPVGTVTTTSNPRDVMRAISTFGSTLKTTAADRSYPTLRGHPPGLKLGEKLEIPDELSAPDTGVRIEVPASLAHAFVVAPLSYYLGATVIPNSTPQITTDDGFSYSLRDGNEFETDVRKILRHVFFLDCIIRTEGIMTLPLQDRKVIEPVLDFDIERAYEQPLHARVETYLKQPFSTIEPYLPEWKLVSRFSSTSESLPVLPYIVNRLSTIIVEEPDPVKTQNKNVYLNRQDSPLIQQLWVNPEETTLACTATHAAFKHSADRDPREDPIEIEIICNNDDMAGELVSIYGLYGDRDNLPFKVTTHNNLNKSELKVVLEKESDFLHYIGHTDEDGFRCTDGKLDVSSLQSVGTKAFFLNSCQSYDQGLELINSGSIGGIVTLDDVLNTEAIRVGKTLAHLLNQGHQLYGAMEIIQASDLPGERYHIVGDGMATVSQSENRLPSTCLINTKGEEITIEMSAYTNTKSRHGSICLPDLEAIDSYHLSTSKIGPISVTKGQLVKYLSDGEKPVILDGELRWSGDIKLDEL